MSFTSSKYMKNLASFTRSSPIFRDLVNGLVNEYVGIQEKIDIILNNSDIYIATDIYLDRIGEIIGLPRKDIILSDPAVTISDDIYRYSIFGKIAQNSTSGSVEEIEQDVADVFGDLLTFSITDNLDMTATYNIAIVASSTDIAYLIELAQNGYFTPKPSGVLINYNVSTISVNKLVYDDPTNAGKYDITDYND